MAPRGTACLVLLLAAGALPAPAQPRVSGSAAAESAASGQSAASVSGSALTPAGGVPSIFQMVAPLAGALVPGTVPAIQPVLQPALGVLPSAAFSAKAVVPAPGAAPLIPAAAPLKEPRDARARKAIATVRETAEHWTGEKRSDDDDPTTSAWWAASQRERAGALTKAGTDARLGPIEGPIVRAVWSAQSKLLRRRAAEDEKAGLGAQELVARYGVRFMGERALALDELRMYVPGLDPELVAGGEALANFNDNGLTPGGYALSPLRSRAEDRARQGYVWIADASFDDFVEIAAHEGFHQGDKGYRDGYRALISRYGEEAGASLGTALLEGLTELRAREALDRLGRDALAGRPGLAEMYGNSLRRRWGGTLALAIERRDADRAKHGYDPYVKMAEAIIAKPGGRKAMEAFVAKGEVTPLQAVLGGAALADLAEIAASADGPKDETPIQAKLAGSLGVAAYARTFLASTVRDIPAPSAAALRELARTAVAAASKELGKEGGAASAWRRRALLKLDLTKDLEAGASPEAIAARVREAARLPAWKRWIPPLPDSFAAMPNARVHGLTVLASPAAAFFSPYWQLLEAFPGGPIAASVVLILLGFAEMWITAELFSAWKLVTRPSRWLPWRWGASPRK